MKKKVFPLFMIVLGFWAVGAGALPSSTISTFNWTGSNSLMAGAYQRALEEVLADSTVADTIHRFFKLAYIHQKLQNEGKATFLYKYIAQKCSSVAPVAYDQIAEMAIKNQQKKEVLAAYSLALQYKMPQGFKEYIFDKMYVAGLTDTDTSINSTDFPTEYTVWLSRRKKVDLPVSENPAVIIVAKGGWKEFDSTFDTLRAGGYVGCSLVKSIAESSWVDSLKAKNLFSLAQIAYSCGQLTTASSFLNHLKKKDDGSTVPESKRLYLSAQINYDSGDISHAISQFKKFEKKYGSTSEVLFYIARAYRKLGKISESGDWYDKHIKNYPSHPKTQEIVWYRAWQKEEQKNFAGAAGLYKSIYTKYTKGDRDEEAYLRHGLAYYRMEKFDSAVVILNAHLKRYPNSSIANAVLYWKAKSLFYASKTREAQTILKQLAFSEPYDYYAYRSRELLGVSGENCLFSIDTVVDIYKTISWLDSIVPLANQKSLSMSDSADYRCGLVLISAGLTEKAALYLENIEKNFPSNLKIQFELAAMYSAFNASTQGFRIARRFSWRIPQEKRGNIPLGMYSVLYPSFFMDTIKHYAKTFDIDPYLVISVIRQESIFNPQIVSPVGAVGLMQIMPYTGKHIAESMGGAFSVDSLYKPFFNIRYGSWYLKELLTKFDGNLVLAIASYNGGPHNVEKWFERNKEEEFDLFIEDLAFSETRTYVKKVMANYWTYQLLSKKTDYFSNLCALAIGG